MTHSFLALLLATAVATAYASDGDYFASAPTWGGSHIDLYKLPCKSGLGDKIAKQWGGSTPPREGCYSIIGQTVQINWPQADGKTKTHTYYLHQFKDPDDIAY
ncbi:hypothetical protein [Cupriavidus metallidurans]|uniref:Uncharacterized protein n=1 Tax=Cupriavidus metallidurans (strain ATCC 43123 / DSM 2839 / NBRC 102507 / CH34) TaxID=266264 RepID=Q1LLS9_CUPMC|nr:hypothetical protein [Cupriavidus metallidurans]ABF08897.1 hypothetical protein; putative exported protein [Cupriavidus metallidurans CH34]